LKTAELILESASLSVLIIEERKFKDIVVGVSHHTPAGIEKLPCPEHPESDENAGYLGRYIAEKLNSCSIIACNYKVDVNKFFRSDYSMQIAQWNPKFLVEIHGHGGKKAKADIEISSGNSENNKWSIELAKKLKKHCSKIENLRIFSICGKFENIYLKAIDSVTIKDGRWIPFHIELPPSLRKHQKSKIRKPPKIGYQFCNCLIESLKEICRGIPI